MTSTAAAILPFDFEGAAVRVVVLAGEPHFVGRDVADRLGYSDANSAIKRHCRGVAFHHPIVDALGRTQETRVLSEPDVLRLIIGSKLPAAERFERWVFEEVLPSIRRTGAYAVQAAKPISIGDQDMLKVRLITACRLVFGPHAAGQLWRVLGLPLVPAMFVVLGQLSLFDDDVAGPARSAPTSH